MRDAPLPLRLSYVAPAFRYYEQPQEGRMREFTQAGVELIGSPGIDADAETLFMAIEACDEIGCATPPTTSTIHASSMVCWPASVLSGDAIPAAKTLMKERNIVGLRAFDKPLLIDFALRRGGRDGIAAAREVCTTPESQAALDRLESLLIRAAALGYGDRVSVDFALLRDLDYYTGSSSKAICPRLVFPLCGGGRYDSLLPKFGYALPAVGWSAGVERLLIALERRGKHIVRRRHRVDVLVSGADVVATRERAAGNVVRYAASGQDEAALVAARSRDSARRDRRERRHP